MFTNIFIICLTQTENMNGKYKISNSISFNDNYASKGYEYFDVWAPEISSKYGEVFWTDQHNNYLPTEIIERFHSKTIAIVGYEHDQVIVTPLNKPGMNPKDDVSVPINWAYNHHYMMWMTGTHSGLKKINSEWQGYDLPSALNRTDQSIPTNQMFSEGNGGESRKSYHGYPHGYAQLIDSPRLWHITPMQIDTRNRDCGINPKINNCTKFIPGFEPKQARYGRKVSKTEYSGILECPCNGRYGGSSIFYKNKTKVITRQYITSSSTCHTAINVPSQCFEAVQTLSLKNVINQTFSDKLHPYGCSLLETNKGIFAQFNNISSKIECTHGTQRHGAKNTSINTSIDIRIKDNNVILELSGPANVWFGFGFNATTMSDQPWTIVISNNTITEHKIGTCGSEASHCPGTMLQTSVRELSNTVVNNIRTVVLSRSVKGLTNKYYTFDSQNTELNFITSVGSSFVFAYHKEHDSDKILLTEQNKPTCICQKGIKGELCNPNQQNCGQFTKNCQQDLVSQKNPTCNSVQYSGGLRCCGHKRFMLDEDQLIRPEELKYHIKFRFWFQEYKTHKNLERIYYQTEAWAGEYDVPPAFVTPGIPIVGYEDWPLNKPTPGTTCNHDNCQLTKNCNCVHELTYKWTVSNIRLIYVSGHCHAPSCLSLNLYKNISGNLELICSQKPIYGKGLHKFDEKGYIEIPPCLFGDEKGLQSSFLLPHNTHLVSIKRNNNTDTGHFGEMASWQMRGTFY